MRTTHTVAGLEVSSPTYDEIAGKLREAGYDHVFLRDEDGMIDMSGIGLLRNPRKDPSCALCGQDVPEPCQNVPDGLCYLTKPQLEERWKDHFAGEE